MPCYLVHNVFRTCMDTGCAPLRQALSAERHRLWKHFTGLVHSQTNLGQWPRPLVNQTAPACVPAKQNFDQSTVDEIARSLHSAI